MIAKMPQKNSSEGEEKFVYFSPQNEREVQIFRERARKLARVPQTQKEEDHLEVVEFCLSQEHYALEGRYVREVYPLVDLTPLPGTPAFIIGIINIRGQILSVVDLKKFFQMPEKGLSDLCKVVVLSEGGREFGILADQVMGVTMVSLHSLQSSLPTLTGIREQYLKGVTSKALIVLDGKKILQDPQMVVHIEI